MDAVPRFRTGRSVEQTIWLALRGSQHPRADYGANATRYIVQDGLWTLGTQVT